MAKFTWNEETVTALTTLAGKIELITQEMLQDFADQLETTKRSVGAKLRKMDYNVQKASDVVKVSKWSVSEEDQLASMLSNNPSTFTYSEIASAFVGGKFGAKELQGKVLSMELQGLVRKADKVAALRTYTEDQEAILIARAKDGAFLEDIAKELDKPMNSVRCKAMSLQKSHEIEIPKQRESLAKTKSDVLEGLEIGEMTVAEIVAATERTIQGVKTMLTRRGLTAVDHDGEKKRAKRDAKAAKADKAE